jgi:hypothetical protein
LDKLPQTNLTIIHPQPPRLENVLFQIGLCDYEPSGYQVQRTVQIIDAFLRGEESK